MCVEWRLSLLLGLDICVDGTYTGRRMPASTLFAVEV
jgi:hypothetical protein